MAKMISARETAKRWNIAEQLVTRYCREGRIDGAEKEGRSWLIPEDAVKPADKRRKAGKVTLPAKTFVKRPLPIGVSDFRDASDQYYYIDKTMLIKPCISQSSIIIHRI